MEPQKLSLLNADTKKLEPQPRLDQELYISNIDLIDQKRIAKPKKVLNRVEVLISLSNTIADSNGINLSNSHLEMDIDKAGKTLIKVIDDETGGTIKQMPPDAILKLSKIEE